MFDFQTKFKRQIEILGLCLSEEIVKPLRTFDLADYFKVEELTIKRDLQDLRSYGIDIHSDKNLVFVSFQNYQQKKLLKSFLIILD